MLPLSLPGGCAGVWRGSNSHFDQACFAAVAGAYGLAWVVASCAVLAWRAASRLTCVVASHAVLTWRAGEGGGLILPALAKSAPTLPSPPRHPGTARCAACGCADRNACPRIPVQAHTGSHGQGVSRSDNLCSQRAEDGSPLVRAQSEVTPPQLHRQQQPLTISAHSLRRTARPLFGRRAK